MTELSIVNVLPSLLGTYGDSGNVAVLRHRAVARGIEVRVIEVKPGDPVPASGDLYFIGGGEDAEEAAAAEHLRASGGLSAAVKDGATVLAICAGLQILGEWFTDASGTRVAGLGLLDVRSGRQESRSVGDVVADMTAREGLGLLVGFENHRGWTELGPDAAPLGVVRSGVGNGAGMPIEGAVQGSVLGTYLHGPVLMLNPQLADMLLEQVVGTLSPFEDARANASRADRLRRCGLTPSGDAAAAAR